DGQPRFKIADFGIGDLGSGKALARAGGGSTGERLTEAVRGSYTPIYASPQQRRGGWADPRDDVCALGAIWSALRAGALPAEAPTGRRGGERLREQGAPAGHVELLEACLEHDPGDRPADGAVLAERLGRPAPAPSFVSPAQPT